MGTQKFFLFAGLILIFIIIISCRIENRRYMPGYYIDWQYAQQNSDKQNPPINENGNIIQPKVLKDEVQFENINADTTKSNPKVSLLASTEKPVITKTIPNISPFKKENLPFYYSINNEIYNFYELKSLNCDTMFLWSGEKIPGKIAEVGIQYKIKYRPCDDPDGTLRSINKPLVKIIKYGDGNQEILSTSPPEITNTGKRKDIAGIFSLFFGIGGIFFSGILLGIAAIIAGIVGLSMVSKHPDKISGLGFAIFGILLGIIDIVLILTALAIL